MMAVMARRSDDGDTALGLRIARNLQALLRANGLNQGQLAYKAGLSTSNVSNLVNGRKNPSFESVAKAAIALNVDPLELAGFKPLQIPEAPATTTDDRLAALESKFERLVQKLAPALQDTADSLAQEQTRSQAPGIQPRPRTEKKRPA